MAVVMVTTTGKWTKAQRGIDTYSKPNQSLARMTTVPIDYTQPEYSCLIAKRFLM